MTTFSGQGLLHEIDDIAILCANGMATEMTNLVWERCQAHVVIFPDEGFCKKGIDFDMKLKSVCSIFGSQFS